MEVYDAVTHNLVTNVTSRVPVFTVNGLESGLGFDISLYAANAKGHSDPVPLHAYTSKAAEKHTGEFVCRLHVTFSLKIDLLIKSLFNHVFSTAQVA